MHFFSRPICFPCRLLAFLALLGGVSFPLGVFGAAPPDAAASPSDPVLLAVLRFVETQTRGLGEQVAVSVEALDQRTRIGDCALPEVFLPPGVRLWGRAHVGVRCSSPAVWLIYVPVSVKVGGSYLVSARRLAAGQALSERDFRVEQGDLTQLPDGVLTSPAQALGQRTRTGLAASQPLRKDLLVRTPLVRQGQTVKIVIRGVSFSVSSDGLALTNGYEGEIVTIKNSAGRTMQGRVLSSSLVEVTR